jgi:hypothetical protein
LQTICLGWLRTEILLISVSWVARMIGWSHQCVANFSYSLKQLQSIMGNTCIYSTCLLMVDISNLLPFVKTFFNKR